MRVDRQRIARALRTCAAADEVAQLIELGADFATGDFTGTLARVHVEKQALGHLRAGAGEGCEGDRAVAVLKSKFKRDAEGIAILRAMAVATEPARRRFLECGKKLRRSEPVKTLRRLILHVPPRQHLRILAILGRGEIEARRRALVR